MNEACSANGNKGKRKITKILRVAEADCSVKEYTHTKIKTRKNDGKLCLDRTEFVSFLLRCISETKNTNSYTKPKKRRVLISEIGINNIPQTCFAAHASIIYIYKIQNNEKIKMKIDIFMEF